MDPLIFWGFTNTYVYNFCVCIVSFSSQQNICNSFNQKIHFIGHYIASVKTSLTDSNASQSFSLIVNFHFKCKISLDSLYKHR